MPRDNSMRALPTTDARRIQLRDAKMWRRETERETRTGQPRSKCPCTLCLFGKPLLRRTHAVHLRDFGRHPMKRLQPQANSLRLSHYCIFRHAHEHPLAVVLSKVQKFSRARRSSCKSEEFCLKVFGPLQSRTICAASSMMCML
jgi:hypothetical protein